MEWATLTIRVPAKPLLNRKEVRACLEIGEDALEGLMAAGLFPRPLRVSPNTLRWKAEWVGLYLMWLEVSAFLRPDAPGAGGPIEGDLTGSAGIDPDSPVSSRKRRDRPVAD